MAYSNVALAVANTQPATSFFKQSTAYAGNGGRWYSQWFIPGYPNAGTQTGSAAGLALTYPVTGALDLSTWPAAHNAYISALSFNTNSPGMLMIADRLWHNGSMDITSTASQTVNSNAWAARDDNQSANGQGVYVALEVNSQTGAGTPTATLTYTNSDGVSGRTGTNIMPTVASAGVGSFFIFSLQDGDKGVRSIQSVQLSTSWTSGGFWLVAFRPIIVTDMTIFNRPSRVDCLTGGAPQVWSNSVLFSLYANHNSTSTPLAGSLAWLYEAQ